MFLLDILVLVQIVILLLQLTLVFLLLFLFFIFVAVLRRTVTKILLVALDSHLMTLVLRHLFLVAHSLPFMGAHYRLSLILG